MELKDIDYGLSGIYKITFDNDKVYIGLSNDIRRRMIEHFNRDLKQKPDLAISKAIKKHKVKSIDIIEFIDSDDREKLQEREKYWINYYDSYKDKNKGYNMTPGGDGASKGIFNNASYISKEDLDSIYNLLLNTNFSYIEIADITNSSDKIVSNINNGIHYRDNKYDYPLRKNRAEKYGLNNKHSSFYGQEDQLLNLIADLKENILDYDILKEKYNIKSTTLSRINQGKAYFQSDETYPLRPVDKGKATRRVFTDEEMNKLKNDLELSGKTMIELGLIYHCDRKIISEINQGTRQNNPNWSYPLRKNKLKTGPKKSS